MAGDVHQDIDAPEGGIGGRHDLPAVSTRRPGRPDELGLAAALGEALGHRAPFVGVAPADHEALRAALDEEARDRLAQPLRPAGDDRDASVDPGCAGGV